MLLLDGESLDVAGVVRVARHYEEVQLSPSAVQKMQASRAVVERLASADHPIYGVNTGFGLLAGVRIAPSELDALQRNLVRSHACGVGDALPEADVRALMLFRANVLAKGLSGIRPVVAERLCDMLNGRITPLVPSRGSVGASGDLAPLAHMALVLIGEGETLDGRRPEPLTLGAKEGISLINGTQAMLAVGSLELAAAEALAEAADWICALTVDAQRGTPRAFDPRIHQARPHPGQLASAANLHRYLEGSEIRHSHDSPACHRVQDAYSLRCAPQVHGAVRDTLAEAHRAFAIEINSATDNPLVFGDEILSGGNFHGEPLALPLDALAVALTVLAGISERRVDRLVNPALNEDLPAFLAARPGLESGLMMLQVTAAALVAENRVLACPASTGSITTSGNKEDFVSMGMTSALKLRQVVANTRTVLAIEAIAAARALDCLAPLRTGTLLEPLRARLRRISPPWTADRPLAPDIAAVSAWLADGAS
jgi:histidine ammonia-lyase